MRSSASLAAFVILLLPAGDVSAEPPAPEGFAMELILPEGARSASNIVVHCLEGCDWKEKTFTCPEGPNECRKVIAGRKLYEPPATSMRTEPEARPILDTACLGLQVISDPPGTRVQKCETVKEAGATHHRCHSEETSAPDSRAFVNHVFDGSPAERAGISAPDVLIELNGHRIQGHSDIVTLIKGARAGEPFVALIERDGSQMTVPGRFGIRMSNATCAVADAKTLAAAAAPESPPAVLPFKLVVRTTHDQIGFNCIEGCAPGGSGDLGGGNHPDGGLVFSLTQDQTGVSIGGVHP